MRKMISDHISEKEVACKCCGVIKYDQTLVDVVEWLRTNLKDKMNEVRVIIKSWHRCEKHDKEIGGKGNHPTGKAVDLYFQERYFSFKDNKYTKWERIDFRKVLDLLKQYPAAIEFAIGLYDRNRLHIEIGRTANWDERTKK